MKRKKIYLFMELAVLFLIFVQYIANLTVEEKREGQAKEGQAVLQERKEENNNNGTEKQNVKEVISQELAKQIENENNVSNQIESENNIFNQKQTVNNHVVLKNEKIVKNKVTLNEKEEKNRAENQKIRVLLKTTGNRGYYHDSVKLVPSEDCVLSLVGNSKKTKLLKAGKAVTFKKSSSWLKKGTVLLTLKKKGTMKVNSIRRTCGNPSYRGTLELTKTKQGIVIVNELLLEEYLYAVVPSEMPVSYGIEALKVQAVCARCYAYSQLGSSAMEGFHADVDDSTSYQVYNNIAETQDSIKAVNETKGLVPITGDHKMITAYYYSTSCGYTANISDAWEKEDKEAMAGKATESNNNTYLVGKPQFIKQKEAQKKLDLSKEENFVNFLEKETRQTYDSAFPWYRWTVSISKKSLQKSVEEHLKSRWLANPSMIEMIKKEKKKKESKKEEEDSYEKKKEQLGTFKDIELVSRSITGMITCMKIKYSKGDIFVYGEYNIRCLLSPGNAKIKRQDGSLVSGLSLLPSSFFCMEKKGKSYQLHGGGYGHGVGMSQNGVKTMVEKGYQWKEILKHYYQGIKITSINTLK